MKTTRQILYFYTVTLAALVLLTGKADAALVISDLNITDNSFSVSFAGTLPSDPTPYGEDAILAVNPDQFATPGFMVGNDFVDSGSHTWSGSQSMTNGRNGGSYYGDYIIFFFDSDLTTNEDITGTFSATWGATNFDPSAVSSLDFYWGTGIGFDEAGDTVDGKFLGSASISDTGSTAALLGAGVAALALARRRLG
jgi:hypothetical protein